MTIPGRVDAAALFLTLDPPAWASRHARAVAEVAAWLATRMAARGEAVDRSLVEAAALLHDVDKILPRGDPATPLAHGTGSATWLAARGHPELGPVVAAHPVTRLADGGWFERWLVEGSPEARIVAYADKRAGQHLETMNARFASWARRYPDTSGFEAARRAAVAERAARLEGDVCHRAGIAPSDVARLRWTGRALALARARIAPDPAGRPGPRS